MASDVEVVRPIPGNLFSADGDVVMFRVVEANSERDLQFTCHGFYNCIGARIRMDHENYAVKVRVKGY